MIPTRVPPKMDMLTSTLDLYRQAMRSTGRSLSRSWISMAAIVVFALLFVAAARLAGPLGGRRIIQKRTVNALLVGATLRLIEQSLNAARTITIQDVTESF